MGNLPFFKIGAASRMGELLPYSIFFVSAANSISSEESWERRPSIPLHAKSTVTRTLVSPLCTYIIARNKLHCKMENATNKLGINRANRRYPKGTARKIDIDIKLWYANYIEAAAKAAFFPAAGCFQGFSPPVLYKLEKMW